MEKQDDPRWQLHISHVPQDRGFASALAEGVKHYGAEVDRTVYQRPHTLDTNTAAVLEERGRHYLRRLKGPEPIPIDPYRVFLSYAREDYEDVFRFHLELLRMGLSTFLDQSDVMGIHLGETWVERIFEMLSACPYMAFFLSPHSVQSAVAGYEVGFFIERMKIQNVFIAIVSLSPGMKVEDFKQGGVPVIEFYRLTAKDAAEQLLREMVAFGRQIPAEDTDGRIATTDTDRRET